MKTKLLIPSLLVAGMLAGSFAVAQQTEMPGQSQPPGATPMPASGQTDAMPPSTSPMPPAKPAAKPKGKSSGGSQGGMSSDSMMMGSPSQPGSAPMGAQSPYMPQKWSKGDRLPAEFRDRQYVIDKYKDYNLPAPRKGYHWVGIGADYYQVSSNGTIYSVGPGGG